jgi:hypothetical protein
MTKDTARELVATLEKEFPNRWKEMQENVYEKWGQLDGATAWAHANRRAPEAAQTALMGALRGWAQTDVNAASQAVGALPRGFGRSALAVAITQACPEEQFPGILAQQAQYAGQEGSEFVLGATALRLAKQDFTQAAEWLASLPESHGGAFHSLYEKWAEADPAGTSAHLAQLTTHSPARDASVMAFAVQLLNEDPASAEKWAATLSTPEFQARWKQQQAINPLRALAELDPATAPLPPEGETSDDPAPNGDVAAPSGP